MLHQILAARPLGQHRRHQLAGDDKLVIAREYPAHQLLLVVADRHQIAAENLQKAVALPHLLPKVIGGDAGIGWIADAAGVALVERQERGIQPGQARRHRGFGIAHREVHQSTAGEGEQRLRRIPGLEHRLAVGLVLVNRVLQALRVVALEFAGGHRNAVNEQHQVDAVFVVHRVMHLPHHPQPVGRVPRQQIGIHPQRRLELAHVDRLLQPQHVETAAQHRQRALAIQRLAQALRHRLACRRAVAVFDHLPGLRLAGLDPGNHILGKQGERAIVAGVVAGVVEPAGSGEVRANLVFEVDFLV